METLYAGLMSGTSMDGVDAALVSLDPDPITTIVNLEFTPYPDSIKDLLADLMADPRPERTVAQEVDVRLGQLYADTVMQLIVNHSVKQVRAIGCHGQTILHKPDATPPFSWQAGDAGILAKLTGIPVVDDFRSADMRIGGHGAPLAPAYHQFAFSRKGIPTAVVNIGGISNITYLPADESEPVIGFDTGPGNCLSDRWIQAIRGLAYDDGGRWANSAKPDKSLLARFMADDFFLKPPPKSLDTRYFSLDWLLDKLASDTVEWDATVVQSTIAALTADSILLAMEKWIPHVERIVLCGGGAYNIAIADRLHRRSRRYVVNSDSLGVPTDFVEACAFAWLAERRINGIPANLPSVTGASRKVLLGSITDPT